MNYSKLLEAEEKRQSAVTTINKVATKEKATILTAFAKDILSFLKLVQMNPKYKFSCEAYPNIDIHYSALFKSYKREGSLGKVARLEEFNKISASLLKSIKEKARGDIKTCTMQYVGKYHLELHFIINDDFTPVLKIREYTNLFEDKYTEFTDIDKAVTFMAEIFVRNRRK